MADRKTELLIEIQRSLWSDLRTAYDNCIRGPGWSILALDLRDRIRDIAREVGPTSWEDIDVTTLRRGVYAEVYDEVGIEYPPIDWDAVKRTEDFIARGGFVSADIQERTDD